MDNEKKYSVDFWGSHPDDDNDDCWTGIDFATKEEALERFRSNENPCKTDPSFMTLDCAFVVIDGPDVHDVRANPLYNTRAAKRERAIDDGLWKSEASWQARMGGELDP